MLHRYLSFCCILFLFIGCAKQRELDERILDNQGWYTPDHTGSSDYSEDGGSYTYGEQESDQLGTNPGAVSPIAESEKGLDQGVIQAIQSTWEDFVRHTDLAHQGNLAAIAGLESLRKALLFAAQFLHLNGYPQQASLLYGEANRYDIFRLYNPHNHDHLLTRHASEVVRIVTEGHYVYEGIAFSTFREPVYSSSGERCAKEYRRCLIGHDHFISGPGCEGQQDEGSLGFVCTNVSEQTPHELLRHYQPAVGDHLSTIFQHEIPALPAHGYHLEGGQGYPLLPSTPKVSDLVL